MSETIILVHGFAEDSRIWDTIAPSLKINYKVLTPDLPGSGNNESSGVKKNSAINESKSTKESSGNKESRSTEESSSTKETGISMESMADYLHQLIVKENISSCTMIGHSMGGYITLAFAEKYPELLNAIGLFHSTAYADSPEKVETRKKNIAFIQKNGSAKYIAQSVPTLFSEESAKEKPGMVKDMIARYSNFSPDSLVHYTAAMMNRPDRTHVLKSFKKPVLFIMGEKDTNIPIEQGLRQCSIPELSYIYIATRSGHLGMLEETEFCLNAMNEFLNRE